MLSAKRSSSGYQNLTYFRNLHAVHENWTRVLGFLAAGVEAVVKGSAPSGPGALRSDIGEEWVRTH